MFTHMGLDEADYGDIGMGFHVWSTLCVCGDWELTEWHVRQWHLRKATTTFVITEQTNTSITLGL